MIGSRDRGSQKKSLKANVDSGSRLATAGCTSQIAAETTLGFGAGMSSASAVLRWWP